MNKIIVLILLSFTITQEIQTIDLRLESFEINKEKFKKGDGVLLSFKVANHGEEKIPNDAYRMEVLVNGKLSSLDNLPDAIDVGGVVQYTKEKGKFHYFVSPNDKEVQVEIVITPKNGYKFKSESQTKWVYRFDVSQ
jgi:hypothetical protein